jgi:hypothetical protein
MSKRMFRGGAVLALTAALTMSGCANRTGGSGDTGAGASKVSEAPADATAALVAATRKLQEDSFKATIKMGKTGTMTGVMDPRQKVGEFRMEAEEDGTSFTMEMRLVKGTNYMRIAMPGADLPGMDGKTWRKMSNMGGAGTLGAFDPTDTARSLESATNVTWAGDDAVTGTIDLGKAGKHLGVGEKELTKLSTKTLPFEAGFDSEGRLTRQKLTMPAVGSEPATTMEITYTDFGVPVSVQAPPAAEIAKN